MTKLVIGVVIAACASAAYAEDDVYDYSWHAPELESGVGVSVIAGGGVMGYANSTVRANTSNVGGAWQIRGTIGSHIPIGLGLAYVGTATGVQSLIGAQSGTLISTNLEASLVWNILPHVTWNPYIFGGAGWSHLNVAGGSFSRADTGINHEDSEVIYPIGAGIGYRRPGGFIADLRGTYRFASDDNLIVVNPGQLIPRYASMDWWEASVAAGFEF